MATRAKIGLMLPDGKIKSVYHHWDGYPEWLGLNLTEKYTTVEAIHKLLDGGDISSLESDQDWNQVKLETPIVLYYKDRGEQNVNFLVETYDEFFTCKRSEQYIYLFNNNQWFCFTDKGFACPIPSKTVVQ